VAPSPPASSAPPPSARPPLWWWPPPRRSLELPPEEQPRPQRNWYGWQILIPSIAADFAAVIGLFTFRIPFLTAGAVVHGASGPAIHLIHGHAAKAGASFLVEAVLPGAALLGTLVSVGMCRGDCIGPSVIGAISIPSTLIGGMVIDTTIFAIEDVERRKASLRGRASASFSLAPLLLPPLGSEQGRVVVGRKGWAKEAPVGLSLIGQF
jgi:hypothetical protein